MDNKERGEKLKALRQKWGLTQPEFARLVGLSDKYISVIERAMQHVPEDTWAKIDSQIAKGEAANKAELAELQAKTSNSLEAGEGSSELSTGIVDIRNSVPSSHDKRDLRSRSISSEITTTQSLKIGIPHSPFAASFIALMHSGLPPRIEVASYSQTNRQDSPCFFDSKLKAIAPNASHEIYYGAPILQQLVGQDKFDAILVARDAHKDRWRGFFRCGTVARAHSAVSLLLCEVKKTAAKNCDPTCASKLLAISKTPGFEEKWKSIKSGTQQVPALYMRGTAAENSLPALGIQKKLLPVPFKHQRTELQWQQCIDMAKDLSENPRGRETNSFLIVSWDPAFSYLIERIHDYNRCDDSTLHIDFEFGYLHHIPEDLESVTLLDPVLDLLFNRSKYKLWRNSELISDLADRLELKWQEIRDALTCDAPIICEIASYLGIPRERCFADMRQHSFEVSFSPQWTYDR